MYSFGLNCMQGCRCYANCIALQCPEPTPARHLQATMRPALLSEIPEVASLKPLSIPAPNSPQTRNCGTACPPAALSPAIHAHRDSLSLSEARIRLGGSCRPCAASGHVLPCASAVITTCHVFRHGRAESKQIQIDAHACRRTACSSLRMRTAAGTSLGS